VTDEGKEKLNEVRGFRGLLVSLLGVLAAAVTLFVVWSYATYGDIRSCWLWFNGYQLIAEQYQIDLGTIPAGESKSGTFRLRNLTGKPIVVLGVQSDCSCVSARVLPVTVSARRTWDFEVLFFADEIISDEVVRKIILNISVDQPMMLLEVMVTVIPNNKEKQDDPYFFRRLRDRGGTVCRCLGECARMGGSLLWARQ
jgi:hypothetical protein